MYTTFINRQTQKDYVKEFVEPASDLLQAMLS